ncbi:MAG: hypothetical protein ACKO7W_14670 [Elainella sp.]
MNGAVSVDTGRVDTGQVDTGTAFPTVTARLLLERKVQPQG